MSRALEKKIAARLFTEFNHRHGRLVPARVQSRGHYAENIIAFGVMCIEIGKSLEQDALNEYLISRDNKIDCNEQVIRDALQSAEQHLSSP